MCITNSHNIHARGVSSVSTHRCGNLSSEELSNSAQGHTAPSRKTRLLKQVHLSSRPMLLPSPPAKEERSQTLPGTMGLNLKLLPKQATTAPRKQGRQQGEASGLRLSEHNTDRWRWSHVVPGIDPGCGQLASTVGRLGRDVAPA